MSKKSERKIRELEQKVRDLQGDLDATTAQAAHNTEKITELECRNLEKIAELECQMQKLRDLIRGLSSND